MSKNNISSRAKNAIGFSGIALLCEKAVTEHPFPQDQVESNTENSTKNDSNKNSEVVENKSSGLIWVIIILAIVFIMLAIDGLKSEDSFNRNTSTTPKTTSHFSKSTKKNYPETKTTRYSSNLTDKPNSLNKKTYSHPEIYPPPDDTSLTLTQQQIEYCLAEGTRIKAGRAFVSTQINALTELYSVIENERENYKLACYYTEASTFCRNWRDDINLSDNRYNRKKTKYFSILGRNNKYVKNYKSKCANYRYYQDDYDNAKKNTNRYLELYRTQGRDRLEHFPF